MNFVEEMKSKAKSLQNSLVLPEGTEERTVIAAGKIIAEKVAKKVILIGNVDEVKKLQQLTRFRLTALTSSTQHHLNGTMILQTNIMNSAKRRE